MESLFEDLDYRCDKRIMFSNGFDQILKCVRQRPPISLQQGFLVLFLYDQDEDRTDKIVPI